MRASRATGVVGLAAGLLAVLGGLGGAGAQESADTSISVLAGVPGEAVDVVVDGEPMAGSLAYNEVSEPVVVEPGRHDVMLGPRGGADEEPDRIELQLDEGDQITVARFLDRTGEPQVDSFPEDRAPVPAGQARLVVRHLAELPEADVRLDGEPIAEGLASGRSATSTVDAGPARLDVVLAGADDPLLPPAEVDLPEGQVTVVSVIGSAAQDDVDAVVQQVIPESAPAAAPQPVTVVQALLGTDVDVWVDGQRQVAGLDATRLAAGFELPVGPHQFAFRLAGDDPDAPPLAVREVEVEADVPQSVVVHLDADGEPTVSTFTDPIAGGAEPGAALLTVRHVGLGGPVDVLFGGQEVASDLPLGEEGSAEVLAGMGIVDVRFVESGTALPPVDVQLDEGESSVLYVAGSTEDGSATVLLQDADRREPAPRTVPTGTPPIPGSATPLLWLVAVVGLAGPRAVGRLRTLVASAMTPRGTRAGRPAWSLGAAVLLLGLVTGASSASGAVRPAGRLPASWTADAAPGIEVVPGLAEQARPETGVRPVLVRIPSIAVDARVVPVGLDGDEVALPRSDDRVGWFRHGAAPGAPRGTAVLLGHVRTPSGPGPFASLRRLEPGDSIRVVREDGTKRRFRVVARRRYHKDDLPAATLFAPDQRPLLVLITCGGPVEGHQYRDNVVVVAEPVRRSPSGDYGDV